jgi:phosphate transport system permease protein
MTSLTESGTPDVTFASNAAIAQPPSAFDRAFDRGVRFTTLGFACLVIALVTYIVLKIAWTARPAVDRFGASLLTETTWDSNRELFGLLPAIWGTLYTSVLGLAIGTFFGLSIAIVLSQDFLPAAVETILKNLIELLAAIPSVVYGLWGIFVVIPAIRPAAAWLSDHLGWIPLFGTPLRGPGVLPASVVLAIMVLPTVSALSREALLAVPSKIRKPRTGSARRGGKRSSACSCRPRSRASSDRSCSASAARWARRWRSRCSWAMRTRSACRCSRRARRSRRSSRSTFRKPKAPRRRC